MYISYTYNIERRDDGSVKSSLAVGISMSAAVCYPLFYIIPEAFFLFVVSIDGFKYRMYFDEIIIRGSRGTAGK